MSVLSDPVTAVWLILYLLDENVVNTTGVFYTFFMVSAPDDFRLCPLHQHRCYHRSDRQWDSTRPVGHPPVYP